MRAELEAIVDALLSRSEPTGEVSLDEIGDALDLAPVTPDEIDLLLAALEAQGRRIGPSMGRDRMADLRTVVATARALKLERARAPTSDEIAGRSGLGVTEVRTALLLARVLSR